MKNPSLCIENVNPHSSLGITDVRNCVNKNGKYLNIRNQPFSSRFIGVVLKIVLLKYI